MSLREIFRARGWPAPVVIGGVGGSGTRLVARLLRECGVALGTDVNESEDANPFIALYDAWVDAYLENGALDLPRFEAELLRAIERHIDPAAHPVWGWKNPRSLFLLPLLDDAIPGLRFVHVVRHGADMATSTNKVQLDKHGRAALGAGCEGLRHEVRAALLWQRVNEAAAAHGRRMPGRYFLVRYEDLCADPQPVLAPVAAALGVAAPARWNTPIARAAPRAQTLDPALLEELRARIGASLARFGYRC